METVNKVEKIQAEALSLFKERMSNMETLFKNMEQLEL